MNDMEKITIPRLTYYDMGSEVVAFSSTRHGGYSVGQYGEFNINAFCGDEPSAIAKNRDALCQLLGIDNDRLLMPHQVPPVRSAETCRGSGTCWLARHRAAHREEGC